MSANFGGRDWPIGLAALLTRMSTPPRASTASVTMARTESSEPVSATAATTLRPVTPAISAAVASSASRPRAATTTSHPSSARTLATALPIPRLAPGTSARFPPRSKSIAASSQGSAFLSGPVRAGYVYGDGAPPTRPQPAGLFELGRRRAGPAAGQPPRRPPVGAPRGAARRRHRRHRGQWRRRDDDGHGRGRGRDQTRALPVLRGPRRPLPRHRRALRRRFARRVGGGTDQGPGRAPFGRAEHRRLPALRRGLPAAIPLSRYPPAGGGSRGPAHGHRL